VSSVQLDVDGPGAPPRRNGELAFDAPWEGRVFGLALAVTEQAGLSWEAFRSRLIEAVSDEPDRPYWESWLVALERLLADYRLA
jgi:nitrile hydratase accessory protein